MTLDFRTKGEVQISMEHYINMMLQDAPEEMKGAAMTPAAPHLFKVNNEDPQLLGPEKNENLCAPRYAGFVPKSTRTP